MKKFHWVCLIAFFGIVACTKSNGDHLDVRAAELRSFVANSGFKLTAFYSDKPIDYIQNDSVVRHETDLWQYVKSYIKDDIDLFTNDSIVTILQNNLKIPGNDSASLTRKYSITSDKQNVYLHFVEYYYLPLQYKLSALDSTSFVVYVDWPDGAKLYSRFEKSH